MHWQPIATAPKDKWILLSYLKEGVHIGYWNKDTYSKKPCPYWESTQLDSWHGMRWCRLNSPTHWMELPPPAKVDE